MSTLWILRYETSHGIETTKLEAGSFSTLEGLFVLTTELNEHRRSGLLFAVPIHRIISIVQVENHE